MTDAADEALITENVELLLARLLGDEPPTDWCDPQAVAVRTGHLNAAAVLSGMTTLDALIYVADARQRGMTFGIDDAPLAAATDALADLHRAMCVYQHDTLHYDATEVAWRALDRAVGGAIAALVMGGLDRLRAELTQRMQALPWPSPED
jgi:hypothetical protein